MATSYADQVFYKNAGSSATAKMLKDMIQGNQECKPVGDEDLSFVIEFIEKTRQLVGSGAKK